MANFTVATGGTLRLISLELPLLVYVSVYGQLVTQAFQLTLINVTITEIPQNSPLWADFINSNIDGSVTIEQPTSGAPMEITQQMMVTSNVSDAEIVFDPPELDPCFAVAWGRKILCPSGLTAVCNKYPMCAAANSIAPEGFVVLSPQMQDGVSEVVWDSPGNGSISGPGFPFAGATMHGVFTLSLMLWGGGASGSSNGCAGDAKYGGSGGHVAFELQIDPMVDGRYVFNIGSSNEDSFATFTSNITNDNQPVEIARAGAGATGATAHHVGRSPCYQCGNSDGCPCRCGSGVPQRGCNCGTSTPSTGGSATVSTQINGQVEQRTGSSAGTAIMSTSGFHAGAGGGSAQAALNVGNTCQQTAPVASGQVGLLTIEILNTTFDELSISLADLPPLVVFPQLFDGVKEIRWLSSGHGFVTGPGFPHFRSILRKNIHVSVQLWGGGAAGSAAGILDSNHKNGGAGGCVAFELQLDPGVHRQYTFTIGGPGEDSVVTWNTPGQQNSVELARSGTGTTGATGRMIVLSCSFNCGNSDGCPCRCGNNVPQNGCTCGAVTNSAGGTASVNQNLPMLIAVDNNAIAGNADGSATQSGDGYMAGAGGIPGESGQSGLLVIKFLDGSGRGGGRG